ncbi:MAG: sugar transferase [Candidatus Andersenbacteria bacterium]|nr:sugar transferase [Candidatus Andersenbacteria bacterium]MBI3251075.1 sugar transferase [Candidatus Andersenbacteria bacterium]
MKRSELFFGAMLVPVDYFALLVAGAGAYFLRVSGPAQELRPVAFALDLPLTEYMQLVAIVSAAIIGVFAIQGLYTLQATRRTVDEFTRILGGITIGFMLVIGYIFFSAELFQSRFIVLAAYALAIVFVTFGRIFIKRTQQTLLRRGMGVHRVLLAGNGQFADELINLFQQRPQLGYRVVGTVAHVEWAMLEEVYRRMGIDEVIQTDPTMPADDNLLLLDFCEQYKIDYRYVPNLFETHAVNVHYRQLGTVPLLELSRTPLEGWGRIAKRTFDVIGSFIGLIVSLPILLIASFAIKSNSAGPIFYRQVRVGRNMKPFEIIKFRSMYLKDCVGPRYGGRQAAEKYEKLRSAANERSGPLFKMRNDPRITKVGRFLRRWRVDELPQLINVLKGEMSLFGPRPHLAEEIARYDKYQRKLFTIKPGVSGMAQVAGNAGLPFDEEARIDIAYIESWSLRLDFILLLKTLKILFTDRNAI